MITICLVAFVMYIFGHMMGYASAPKVECKHCGSKRRHPRSGTDVRCVRCGKDWDPVVR